MKENSMRDFRKFCIVCGKPQAIFKYYLTDNKKTYRFHPNAIIFEQWRFEEKPSYVYCHKLCRDGIPRDAIENHHGVLFLRPVDLRT